MKVLNLGSLNIDKTYTLDHFAEAGETIQATGYEEFCGGKGLNQSIALAKAGADVFHAGCVGRDGTALIETLKRAGVKTELIRTDHGPSGHAVIQVTPGGQNKIIIFGGANSHVPTEYIDQVLEHFNCGDMLLLQNEISNVSYAIEHAKEKGLTVVFNPSPINNSIARCDLSKTDYFILNEVEGRKLAGTHTEDAQEILRELRKQYPKAVFVLTLGDKGSYYADETTVFHQKIFPSDVIDTTGAGDTFTGYFLAGIAHGRPARDAMRYASLASSLSVSRHGASPSIPDQTEVCRIMAQQPQQDQSSTEMEDKR